MVPEHSDPILALVLILTWSCAALLTPTGTFAQYFSQWTLSYQELNLVDRTTVTESTYLISIGC